MKKLTLFFAVFLCAIIIQAQNMGDIFTGGQLHGNFSLHAQYYNKDSIIGAQDVPEDVRMNGFLNLIYSTKYFEAGVRYEAYQNPILGYPKGYKGEGIPYRYVRFHKDRLDVTAGNFYEQFGSGLIFRSYEERQLGYDNAMDGFRIKYEPINGINLTGVIGRQRLYFAKGDGIVRGFDGQIDINELFSSKEKKEHSNVDLILGGSFVSKFQQDQDSRFNLPENVGAWSGRAHLTGNNFSVYGEYAYKINDPSDENGYIYKSGNATLLRASYFQRGFSVYVSAKRIDNMSFRSDRNATLNDLMINYLPSITPLITYNLLATLYPYATQPNGETGADAKISYKIKRGSALGGKYGTKISADLSSVYNIDTTMLNDMNGERLGYKSDYFGLGNQYYQSLLIAVDRKINKWFHVILTYDRLYYDKVTIQGAHDVDNIKANVYIADLTFKLSRYHAIRAELQALTTKQDQGSWATAQIEYTFAPHWSFAVVDQFNYGNSIDAKKIHYYYGTIGYTRGANRISLGYGRQKAGIFCVGGVCRQVPAANGVTLSITSSF